MGQNSKGGSGVSWDQASRFSEAHKRQIYEQTGVWPGGDPPPDVASPEAGNDGPLTEQQANEIATLLLLDQQRQSKQAHLDPTVKGVLIFFGCILGIAGIWPALIILAWIGGGLGLW